MSTTGSRMMNHIHDQKNQAAVDWRGRVVEIARSCGLDWGGDWISFKDWPHFQFDTLKPSPSDRSIELYVNHGIAALWKEVGALEGAPAASSFAPPPNVIADGVADTRRMMNALGVRKFR